MLQAIYELNLSPSKKKMSYKIKRGQQWKKGFTMTAIFREMFMH